MIVFETKNSFVAFLLLCSWAVATAQNYGRHGKHLIAHFFGFFTLFYIM